MSGVTSQQHITTNDGTVIVIDSWLAEQGQVVMSPGESEFTATCPRHGQISSGYVAMLVGYDVLDHANAHHGGLTDSKDLLEVGPYTQL
jgi:hypothetical protein